MKRVSIFGLTSLLCNAGGLLFLLGRHDTGSMPVPSASQKGPVSTADSATPFQSEMPEEPVKLTAPLLPGWVAVPMPKANIGRLALTEMGDVAPDVAKALHLSGEELRQINIALSRARAQLFAAELRHRQLKSSDEGDYFLLPPNPAAYHEIRQSLAESLGTLRNPAWSGPVIDLLMSDSWFLSLLTDQKVSFLEQGNSAMLDYCYPSLLGAHTGEGTAVDLPDFHQSYIALRYGHLFNLKR